MATKRLFVGTFLSAEQQHLLGKLKDNNEALTGLWHRKLRWVKSAKLHMTWFFLGDLHEDLISGLCSSLESGVAGHKSGEIVYDRIEFWPSPRKPRQLVMTPQHRPDHLAALAKEIRTTLSEFAVKPDEREFRPHITLLRFDAMAKQVSHQPLVMPDWFLADHELPLVHRIRSVELIESHMGSGRDDYEVIHSFPLA